MNDEYAEKLKKLYNVLTEIDEMLDMMPILPRIATCKSIMVLESLREVIDLRLKHLKEGIK